MDHQACINLITEMLRQHAGSDHARDHLAREIAEKSLLMRHLYQDMGFETRKQMNEMMTQNYPALAAKKPDSVRWKKYLFDCIEEVAPACAYCKDSTDCFSCELVFDIDQKEGN